MENKCEKYQKTGLQRDVIDKYYTCPSVVEKCMKLLLTNVKIKENDLVVEPSAGNGSFISSIESLGCHNMFIDIEPQHDLVIKEDYLSDNFDMKIDEKIKHNKIENIHVIGNPPFGRQSSLAIKFIKKSCCYCDTLAFILPRSFKKESMKKHIPLNFHCLMEEDVMETGFIVNGESYNVPCIFQIWIKKSNTRNKEKKIFPLGYKFVKKTELPDISFRRVGVNAGSIYRGDDIINKSEQSHYFIRFDKELDDDTFKKICKLNYKSRNDTVGPRYISKPELTREFNSIFDCINV